MEETKHIVQISTDVSAGCEHCEKTIEGDNFAENVNHYLQIHHYKLLHVGQQSSVDMDGKPYQLTVAVLGK